MGDFEVGKRWKLWVANSRKYFTEVRPKVPFNKGHSHHAGSGIRFLWLLQGLQSFNYLFSSPPSSNPVLLLWSNQEFRWSIRTKSQTESNKLLYSLINSAVKKPKEHSLPNVLFSLKEQHGWGSGECSAGECGADSLGAQEFTSLLISPKQKALASLWNSGP